MPTPRSLVWPPRSGRPLHLRRSRGASRIVAALLGVLVGYLTARAWATPHDDSTDAVVGAMVRIADQVDVCETALEWSEAERADVQAVLDELLGVRRAAVVRTVDVIRDNPWLCWAPLHTLPRGSAPAIPVELPAEHPTGEPKLAQVIP